LQLPINLRLLELRKEIIQLNGQVLPGLLDGLNLSTPNILVEDIEGPIRRPKRGGSEWEPVKILLEGD
jgi:hypothetical protein